MDLLVVSVTNLSLFLLFARVSCLLGELELFASSLLGKFIRVLCRLGELELFASSLPGLFNFVRLSCFVSVLSGMLPWPLISRPTPPLPPDVTFQELTRLAASFILLVAPTGQFSGAPWPQRRELAPSF